MIRKYCKAYYLKDLRLFSEWTEKREESDEAFADEDVVYLWDDFVVVRSPVLPGGVVPVHIVTGEAVIPDIGFVEELRRDDH